MKTKNLTQKQIQSIEDSQYCTEREIKQYLSDVNNQLSETNSRIWYYIETATANHDIKEIKKHLKNAGALVSIIEKIRDVESTVIKYGDNYIPQFNVLTQQLKKIINL
ncbi:MAG: hypothetical protein FWF53_00330 [Candidatus Azobacteroides sp.]|nr:hypothetical protein [Candidatus Azobacteroides sp.]